MDDNNISSNMSNNSHSSSNNSISSMSRGEIADPEIDINDNILISNYIGIGGGTIGAFKSLRRPQEEEEGEEGIVDDIVGVGLEGVELDQGGGGVGGEEDEGEDGVEAVIVVSSNSSSSITISIINIIISSSSSSISSSIIITSSSSSRDFRIGV